jgi:hypothetical protein
MSNAPNPPGGSSLERLRTWLRSDVTITAPGWAVALGGALVLVLLLAALD